ncbi:hypothetical protein LOTGIDRAFT_155099 [Lottia gigantea]|uniref:Uncharacterized protein n=1 Tax=Lottia gigantea TaxID=225164 RepID=V3ZXC3_LOTGI|nr:hypothetical protein LOTGIDRAFT_155099 [Lottia gigantea]ESO85611.1 hypothetical protein LOTGIDRAFT_155099 [Lottia gigantea]
MDLVSLPCKAWVTAQRYYKWKSLPANSYPYCNIPPHQRKAFMETYEEYARQNTEDDVKEMYTEDKLRKWQKACIRILKETEDREVVWIYDRDGGAGKTYLCKHLNAVEGAAIFQNGNSKDISYAYNGEKIVCFNYTRDDEKLVNYAILENLKDGYLFSAKYDSRTKHFQSPKVICMANFVPDETKMSEDRYWNFQLVKKEDEYQMIVC